LTQNMDVALRLPLLPTVLPVELHLTAGLNREFHVCEFVVKAAVQKMTLRAEGFIQSNTLYYRTVSGENEPVYGLVRLKAPFSLLPAIEPLVVRYFDLKVGKVYSIPMADPFNGGNALEAKVRIVAKEDIELDGEEVPAYRIETQLGEAKKIRWVDTKGGTLRSEIFQNIMAEKSNYLEMHSRYPSLTHEESLPADFDPIEFKRRAVAATARPQEPGQQPISGVLTPQIIQQALTPLLKGI
ncbi:TPA: hypothetical protein DDW35_06695, partial [Candidatus Sumerlaeota bacterium]|nr:hypothetical protein [Candidatus Sumerlaeota bacterium]